MNQTSEARTRACPKCAEPVLAFDVDVFTWSIHLETNDLPITADFNNLLNQYRLWEYYGPRLGWSPKYSGDRNWRPVRATHLCADSPYIPLFDSKTAAQAARAERAINDRPASGGDKQKHKETTS